LEAIRPIVEKRSPNHLEELRIEKCKMGSNICGKLIDMLNERSFLKKLALVDVGLDDHCVDNLCGYLCYSFNLEELDISSAAVSPKKMLRFLEVISENKKISNLNLANI